MAKRLDYKELKKNTLFNKIEFKSTSEITPFVGIIGQQRGEKALKFGLNIKKKGYNIYVSGISGSGKATFAKKFAEEIALTEKTPEDMCYVYNFKNPKLPKLLKLPPGMGKNLLEDMDELVASLTEEITRVFTDKDFENQKGGILKSFQEKKDNKIKEMSEYAKKYNFGVKSTNSGIYFMPLLDGEALTEEQYEELSQEDKDKITENSESVQESAAEFMRDIKEYEKQARKDISNLEYSTSLFIVGRFIGELFEKYEASKVIVDYLKEVKEDILNNIHDFNDADSDDEESVMAMLPWYSRRGGENSLTKYKINLIADNSETKGAPVIEEFNPTYSNIVGDIEYDNEYGNFTTDFMKIRPGALHKANGGYLIVQAHDLFSNPYAWDSLRRVLRTGEITIDPLREYATGISLSGIKPEAAQVNVKVIIVGSPYYYELISYYEDDFHKLFKIRADFDYEMDYNVDNLKKTLGFVKSYIDRENCMDFDYAAIGKLIEVSLRDVERNDRLTARFSLLTEIISEASAWASMDNQNIVTEEYVIKAVKERDYRLNMYEEKLDRMIEDNSILINTTGSKIGQINGLAVLDIRDYTFANPARITATTYAGRAGIINIEKEAEMSGSIHDKGVQVIIGYLGSVYAQEFPLSLSCRICFEQNYSGIDGDSASSAELYAIISSLSDMPLSQEIAVTGSINQFGEIQPIGGVSYKVEGFFDICSKRGLTGTQGVIIPEQNIPDLVLKDEVLEAIKENKFHIYPIKKVSEGIELLMGSPAGEKDSKGKFPPDSVHGKALKKLKKFYKRAAVEI